MFERARRTFTKFVVHFFRLKTNVLCRPPDYKVWQYSHTIRPASIVNLRHATPISSYL